MTDERYFVVCLIQKELQQRSEKSTDHFFNMDTIEESIRENSSEYMVCFIDINQDHM